MYRTLSFSLLLLVIALLASCQPPATPQHSADRDQFLQQLSAFPVATLPLEIPYASITNTIGPALDSQFVSRYIDEQLYQGECSCQYGQGKLLLQSDQYVALLLPLDWNAGTTYELHTFTLEGKSISKMKLAQYSEQSITGRIDSSGRIRQLTVASFLEEEAGPSTETRQLAYFQIQPTGVIQESIAPTEETQAWLGKWNWKAPAYGNEGTLTILPDRYQHVYYQFIHSYNNGNRVRDHGGVALVEEEGRSVSSLKMGCTYMEKTKKGIQVDGNCIESLEADFSGLYLNEKEFPYHYWVKNDSLSDDFCDAYQVWDGNNQVVSLPGAIQEHLNCGGMLDLSPDWQQLIYSDEKGISIYEFRTNEKRQLIELQDELDGLSDLAWSLDGQRAAFVEIQQDALPQNTRLHVLSFEGDMISTQYFDIPVHFICGGSCFSIPDEDFWWDTNGQILYLDNFSMITQERDSAQVKPTVLKID